MNASPMSFGFGFWLNRLFAYMGGKLLTVQSLTHTHSNGDIFHDSDNMPKHVEMVRTKCQPKIGTDKMPTTIKSPDKIWHFVRLAFCPHTPCKALLNIIDDVIENVLVLLLPFPREVVTLIALERIVLTHLLIA